MIFKSEINGTQNIDTFIDNLSCDKVTVEWSLNVVGSQSCATVEIDVYSVIARGIIEYDTKPSEAWRQVYYSENRNIQLEVGSDTDFRGDVFPVLAEIYEDKVIITF